MLMKPIIEKFAASNHDVIVGKIDTINKSMRESYKIVGVPQLHLFREGKQVGKNVGPLSERELHEFTTGDLIS